MNLKDIPWKEKQLLVFFGKDVKNRQEQIHLHSKGFFDFFPEHQCFHPWEHVELLEKTIKTINRHPDGNWTIITNSSYILDHLGNLMQGAYLGADKKFTRTNDPEAFIDKDKIGVYVCENGKIKNALPKKPDDFIIGWKSLSVVAEWLCDQYFEMQPEEKP